MKLMAEAGMNLIAVGGEDWGALEPREGEYRLSPIAAAIEAAERRGLRVLVHLPTGTVPPWLARREPETVCGPYRRADITHPAYLQAAKNLIRELVKATAAAPNVAGYRLDAGRQVWGARSPRMLEGFRDWMAERFPSPEALAEAYGPELRFVGSFGELP
ncbi:MAG: beta-galactosidase, partial [Oscillospiraceae bacterium]|nr:beta-galactosidase [Oscillospiraceae bacterium]